MDARTRKSLDLIIGTFGTQRFVWRPTAKGAQLHGLHADGMQDARCQVTARNWSKLQAHLAVVQVGSMTFAVAV